MYVVYTSIIHIENIYTVYIYIHVYIFFFRIICLLCYVFLLRASAACGCLAGASSAEICTRFPPHP